MCVLHNQRNFKLLIFKKEKKVQKKDVSSSSPLTKHIREEHSGLFFREIHFTKFFRENYVKSKKVRQIKKKNNNNNYNHNYI